MSVGERIAQALATSPGDAWSDLVKKRLEAALSTKGNMSDLWMQWFNANGYTTGTLTERAFAYWNATNAPQNERNILTLGWSVFFKLYLPSPPTEVSAVAGTGQATVSFTPPTFTGNTSIIDYEAISSPGNIVAAAVGSPIVVTGLSPGDYTFTVRARNSVGQSVASAPSNTVTIA
jgi:hypothetical protein